MTDWTRPSLDSEPPPGDEKLYESEDDGVALEAHCSSCGVILTTLERGFSWPFVDGWPSATIRCVKCK